MEEDAGLEPGLVNAAVWREKKDQRKGVAILSLMKQALSGRCGAVRRRTC